MSDSKSGGDRVPRVWPKASVTLTYKTGSGTVHVKKLGPTDRAHAIGAYIQLTDKASRMLVLNVWVEAAISLTREE